MGFEVKELRKSHGAESVPVGSPVLVGAPRLVRNSSSATKDNLVVYWTSPKGEIQIAPDSRISQYQLDNYFPEYRGWKRCEANGAKEIEKIALIVSRQEFERKKKMKVEQHLREWESLEFLETSAKLNIAKRYSPRDIEVNKKNLQRTEKRKQKVLDAICAEFDPTRRTTFLDVEIRPASTSSLAHIGQKVVGIS